MITRRRLRVLRRWGRGCWKRRCGMVLVCNLRAIDYRNDDTTFELMCNHVSIS
jgi:hypothetical protein